MFSDDWGRHPSSCQHLIRNLTHRYRVHWVNTIGTRAPRLDWATLRRGWEKAGQWFRRNGHSAAVAAPLTVHNPRMWPWMRSRSSRRLNRYLLQRQLGPIVGSAPRPVFAVTTIPLSALVMDSLAVDRWVYYCVDDFSKWPGLEQGVLEQLERELVRRADVIIAVSEVLRDRLARMGRESHLLTHGVDASFWQSSNGVGLERVQQLARPLVVFWGVVDRRMDVAMVRCLAREMTTGTIVLAGPEHDPDPELFRIDRVVRLGPIPYEELPRLAHEAAVLVMPYDDLPVTRAIQPLKMKEYLATGRPVVVRKLPATEEWADCLDQTDSPEDFARIVKERIETGLPETQKSARRRLVQEDWQTKARLFESWAFKTDCIKESSLTTANGVTAANGI